MTEGADKLTEENSKTFHSKVEKLLWVIKGSQLDIENSIYFLCTWLKDPDIQYCGKLRRLLNFLNQTIGGNHVIGDEIIYHMLN